MSADALPKGRGDWILEVPGLRRYAQRLAQLSRRLAVTSIRLERAQQRLSHSERRVRQLKEDLRNTRKRVPTTEPLYHTLAARRAALMTPSRQEPAADVERAFEGRSPCYAAALTVNGASGVADADRAVVAGLTMWVPRDRHGALGKRLRKGWLPFREILAQRELGVGNVMLDIGANVGVTAIPRVIAGDAQRVYAAEPEPLNYACLVRNVIENDLRGLVLPDHAAISDVDGEVTLRRSDSMSNHVIVPDVDGASEADGIRRVRVPAYTLDTWVRRHEIEPESISFVKVDTQGWESHVLAGASDLLRFRHIAWAIEFAPRLLARSGRDVRTLLEQIERHFTHVIDTRGDPDWPRAFPVGHLRKALAYILERETHTFTNLVLYNAAR